MITLLKNCDYACSKVILVKNCDNACSKVMWLHIIRKQLTA